MTGSRSAGPRAYRFSDRAGDLDEEVVTGFLLGGAYWGRYRDGQMIVRQLHGAWRVVCCLDGDGGTVGFARAVSDGVAFAYLADVFVLPDHRGRGLGRELVRVMIEEGDGSGFRWLLHTADAHGLYEPFGFAAPDATLLERPHRSTRSGVPPAAPGGSTS